MFLRKFSTGLLSSLINSTRSTSRSFSSVRSKNELNPFDYDTVPSDFDDEPYQKMLEQEDAFGVHKLIDLQELFEHRCHLGHKTGSLNEYMKPYLFGHRQDITIFDLNQTVEHLKRALNFTAHIAFRDGIILLVNPARETAHLIEKTAIECGEYSQCRAFTHKSILGAEKFFRNPVRLPDLMIVFKTMCSNFEQHPIIRTAAKNLTPTVAIVDSNCDPRLVTYPVPGNDDTPCSIELYAKLFKQAILLGKAKRKELITKPERPQTAPYENFDDH